MLPVIHFPAGLFSAIENSLRYSQAQGAPPVSLMPVVHLDLRISPQIFEKNRMTLTLFLGAWGKMIHGKPEAKNLVTLSL
jgi:hypothetical protein